jgi:hypothetical protein
MASHEVVVVLDERKITVRRKETNKTDPGFPPKGLDLPYTLRVSTKPGS